MATISVVIKVRGRIIHVGNSGIEGEGVIGWFGEVVGVSVNVVIGEGVGDCEGVREGEGVVVDGSGVKEGVTVGVGVDVGIRAGIG
jgi:hypothetical protein